MYTLTDDYLAHHGIKGQKWGERRFQNEDGTLTPAGEERYRKQQAKAERKEFRKDVKSTMRQTKMIGNSPETIKRIKSELTAKKGKEYANKVLKSAKAEKITKAALGTLATVGAGVLLNGLFNDLRITGDLYYARPDTSSYDLYKDRYTKRFGTDSVYNKGYSHRSALADNLFYALKK